jgi:iron complex outermembrane receptor protein/vitamin B12 transporter
VQAIHFLPPIRSVRSIWTIPIIRTNQTTRTIESIRNTQSIQAIPPALVIPSSRIIRNIALLLPLVSLAPGLCLAADQADHPVLYGSVRDPLGAVVSSATLDLLGESAGVADDPNANSENSTGSSEVLAHATVNAAGAFHFSLPAAGRYRVRVTAPSFHAATSAPIFVSASGDAEINLTLATETLTQQVTVTATGTPTPQAQTGASITVLDASQYRYSPEMQEPLRLVPGLQITQTGQTGGTTSLFIRGGNYDDNKVLIDGVPANDIGGAVEFANIASVGIQSIEVLREPDSAIYGSDALAGVVNLTTARGTTPLPLLTYSGDGGNFGSYRDAVAASGTLRQFDYYSAFARLDTRNSLPDNSFHNATYSGNFGWTPNSANDLRFTVRHLVSANQDPNALYFYGIPDDARTQEQDDYYSAVWSTQTNQRWHNQLRYGGLRLRYQYTDYAPTGIPQDPTHLADTNYLGAPVTITGANGYSVSGQAIFQYGGTTYPNFYVAPSSRDFAYAQTDYQFNPHLVGLAAFKFEHEDGSNTSLPGGLPSTIDRENYDFTLQVGGDLGKRLFYTLGSGLEDNGLFGFAATPRASLAYYLARPTASRWLGGTKLHGTFGKGIKEPSIYYQTNSLYAQLAALPNGQALIAADHISPIGPETSRTYDGGIDQELWNSRMRFGATYFHNEFTHMIEYVPPAGLVEIGIPQATVGSLYGAAVNSQAFRAQGLELEAEGKLSSHLFARGGYTFLDAVVQRSFSSDNLSGGSFNTSSNFSSMPIGAFSPLDGQRPFRRAPQSGYFALTYNQSRWYGALSGTLVGSRDDSDYLSDANYGNSLLLPNHNLLGAYQRLQLNGSYRISRAVTTYAHLQNLLSQHSMEAFGYPALPFTIRAGITISLGGESWRLN